jgi:hypothetical protein
VTEEVSALLADFLMVKLDCRITEAAFRIVKLARNLAERVTWNDEDKSLEAALHIVKELESVLELLFRTVMEDETVLVAVFLIVKLELII